MVVPIQKISRLHKIISGSVDCNQMEHLDKDNNLWLISLYFINFYYCLVATLILVTRGSCLLSKFEMFGSLEAQLLFDLAYLAFQTKNNLTGGLSLLVKDWLGLTTETHLLRVVTPLSLSKVGGLACLVLCHLVDGVLLAFRRSTESLSLLRNIHHFEYICEGENKHTKA